MHSASEAIDDFDLTLTRLATANSRRKELLATIARNEAEVVRLQAEEADWARAADVIRSFSDAHSEHLKEDIERLVSHGLTSVFDEPMQFKVTTRLLRGASSVEFTLVSNEVERPVLGSHGGGVAQVVGFVLRVVVTMLNRQLRPVLFLDEPFSQVSAEYRPRLAAFVRELVDSTPLQIVMVTHDTDLPEVADVRYRFSSVNGTTRVVKEEA